MRYEVSNFAKHVSVCVSIRKYVHLFVHVSLYVPVCVSVCVCVCMYMCMCVCMRTYECVSPEGCRVQTQPDLLEGTGVPWRWTR